MWDDFVTEEMAAELVRSHGVDPNSAEELTTLLGPGQEVAVLSAALGFLVCSPSPLALEAAKELLLHENSTVRRQCLYLLAELMGKEGLRWYVKSCKARECRGATEYCAREFVLIHGDESVVPLVAGWAGKQIGKGKVARIDYDGQSARTRALAFLARFPENKHSLEIFAKAAEHWACFAHEEVAWLSEQVAYFQKTASDKPPRHVPVPFGHPVFAACDNGEVAVVREYLDQGGSVYGSEDLGRNPAAPIGPNLGPSLAMRAVEANRLGVLQLLIERGHELDRPPKVFGQYLIDLAWSKGHREIVEFLIDAGASFQLSSPYRPSFFWLVCEKGTDVPLVEKMIRLGAALDEPYYNGTTPLMKAAEAGNVLLMNVLLSGGANTEIKNADHETALMQAIRKKQAAAAACLLDHGADLEAKGYGKRTPIMYAMEAQSSELVGLLLARGANLNAKDKQSRSVIVLAKDFYGGEVWEVIRKSLPDT